MIRTCCLILMTLYAPLTWAGIYKCTASGERPVTYTDRPCPAGSRHDGDWNPRVSWIDSGGRIDQKPAIRALFRNAAQRSERERKAATQSREDLSRKAARKAKRCAIAQQQWRENWNAPRERRRELQKREALSCR